MTIIAILVWLLVYYNVKFIAANGRIYSQETANLMKQNERDKAIDKCWYKKIFS